MDYRNIFAISATGMNAEKFRLDVAAANLANMNSVAEKGQTGYQVQRVKLSESRQNFATRFEQAFNVQLNGVQITGTESLQASPRKVYEPGHPQADEQGYIQKPGVNHLQEMLTVNEAIRAYEANVVAMNSAKRMCLKALEIGGGNGA